MKIKCDYCGSYINDTDEHCSNCGSVNAHLVRTADHTPRTIEELKQWYADHHLPPYETTRFFIGIDYKGARAFGIYEEDGKFTVYKNKDDGTRVLRYYGSDEAYAVNELYLKLKSEILNQKSIDCDIKNIDDAKELDMNGKIFIPMFFVSSPLWLGILRFIFGIANAALMPAVQTVITVNVPPEAFGRIFSYNQSFQASGGVIGPLLGGAIYYAYDVSGGIILGVFNILEPYPFLLYLSGVLVVIGIFVGFVGSYFSVTRSLRRTR